jgi:hypothetical protein
MPKYNIIEGRDLTGQRTWDALQAASDEQLEKWAGDENCKQRDDAAQELEDRRQRRRAAEYRASVAPKPKEQALTSLPSADAPTTASSTATNSPNLGTIVFAGFALLSLAVCFTKGLVPIYLVEAALWAGLAWYWHKKRSASETATLIILLCAVTVAAGEGYLIGRASKVPPRTLPADFWSDAEAKRQSAQPATPPNPPPGYVLDQPSATPPNPPPGYLLDQPKKAKSSPVLGYATVSKWGQDMYMRCAFNTGSSPCLMLDGPENDFSGRLASLKMDDRVEILSARVRAPNGTEIYKVRFQKWTGWVDADSLTLEEH